jgi:hypothetical protein
MIRKSGAKWCLYAKKKDKSGKRRKLGCYSTKSGAENREKQVKMFKHLEEEANMKLTKKRLKEIINEELEVILTDEEAEEMFDLDLRVLVEEVERINALQIQEKKKDKKWMQKAVKHPGRCANMGGPRCPEGSPQYRLAQRFKKAARKKKRKGGTGWQGKV